jgi:hypothetical protein
MEAERLDAPRTVYNSIQSLIQSHRRRLSSGHGDESVPVNETVVVVVAPVPPVVMSAAAGREQVSILTDVCITRLATAWSDCSIFVCVFRCGRT